MQYILGIKWTERVTNKEVMDCADIPSLFKLVRQHRPGGLGYVYRMKNKRIPKDLLYGQMVIGKRAQGHPPYASKISISVIGRSIVRGFKGEEDYCNREKHLYLNPPRPSKEGNTTIENDFTEGILH